MQVKKCKPIAQGWCHCGNSGDWHNVDETKRVFLCDPCFDDIKQKQQKQKDNSKQYCITTICKDDLFQEITTKYDDSPEFLQQLIEIIDSLDDDDMERIASMMAEAYMNDFWVHLSDIMDDNYFNEVLAKEANMA